MSDKTKTVEEWRREANEWKRVVAIRLRQYDEANRRLRESQEASRKARAALSAAERERERRAIDLKNIELVRDLSAAEKREAGEYREDVVEMIFEMEDSPTTPECIDAARRIHALYTAVDYERAGHGAALIAAERKRQQDEEGWTPEHDATHDCGEIARAASFYVEAALICERAEDSQRSVRRQLEDSCRVAEKNVDFQQMVKNPARHHYGWKSAPREWPWDIEWWKPSPDPIRNLVKAGALFAAEIDRLQHLTPADESEAGNG